MSKPNWALLAGDSLLAREIRDLITDRRLPIELHLYNPDPTIAVLTEQDGEPTVMAPIDDDALKQASVIFLAGGEEAARKTRAQARGCGATPVWIDLSGALEDLPEARLRAPALDGDLSKIPAGAVQVVAHPAAIAVARLLLLIHAHSKLRRAVITVFEPVSTHGQPGVDELHKQMVALLGFQELPQTVFDTQVAFNLLPRYGDKAEAPLSHTEDRIERHLATLIAARAVPLPSLRLLHAPVFHGYCASLWIELEARPAVSELERHLTAEGVDLRTADLEPPSNTGVAGHGGITVGDITPDRNDPRGLWVWLAADNLRLTAENAVLIAGLATGK